MYSRWVAGIREEKGRWEVERNKGRRKTKQTWDTYTFDYWTVCV